MFSETRYAVAYPSEHAISLELRLTALGFQIWHFVPKRKEQILFIMAIEIVTLV